LKYYGLVKETGWSEQISVKVVIALERHHEKETMVYKKEGISKLQK